ncbi:MAG: glycosyltransferase family 4 protein [Lachnospiraceae bacterium]|nr:glycosyltransferase family 4 protein [Lachnospiraceae bacterium]
MFYSPPHSIGQVFLYKEIGEIPYYFSKIYDYHTIVDDFFDVDFSGGNAFRTVELQSYKNHNRITKLLKIWKIFRMARKIDILYLLSITPDSMFKMLAYRLGGGRGKIYLKLDLGIYAKDGKDLLKWGNMSLFLKTVHFFFKPLPDVYTVETKRSYERLRNSYYGDLIEKGKLFRLPNGFDPEILEEIGVTRRPISGKEKIMITVGRLGTHQKNTELLLDVLAKVDLQDWKFYCIGPIEDSFKGEIERFYSEHPEKKDSVIFTGMISQKDKFEYYDKARVFVLTSRHEGFAFALVEAAYMKNYIVSTDVGGAEDVLDYTGGVLFEPEGDGVSREFAEEIQRIVSMSDAELDGLVVDDDKEEMTWEYILSTNEAMSLLTK